MQVETLFDEMQRSLPDNVPILTEETFFCFLNKASRQVAYDADFWWKWFKKQGKAGFQKYEMEKLNIIELVHVFWGTKQLSPMFMAEPLRTTTQETPKYHDLLWSDNRPILFISPPPNADEIIHIFYKDIPNQIKHLKAKINLPSCLWKSVELLTHHFIARIYERADARQYKEEYNQEIEKQNNLHAESEPILGVKGDVVFYETKPIV